MSGDWQRHVLASGGYLELALVLEEIAPEDKTRTEVLGARVALYITAKKWDMAAAVASHLVKVEPENEAWWINLAYSVRRSEGIKQAEAILATRASSVAWRTPRSAFAMRSSLIRMFGNWRSTMKISDLCGIGLLGCSSLQEMAEALGDCRAL